VTVHNAVTDDVTETEDDRMTSTFNVTLPAATTPDGLHDNVTSLLTSNFTTESGINSTSVRADDGGTTDATDWVSPSNQTADKSSNDAGKNRVTLPGKDTELGMYRMFGSGCGPVIPRNRISEPDNSKRTVNFQSSAASNSSVHESVNLIDENIKTIKITLWAVFIVSWTNVRTTFVSLFVINVNVIQIIRFGLRLDNETNHMQSIPSRHRLYLHITRLSSLEDYTNSLAVWS